MNDNSKLPRKNSDCVLTLKSGEKVLGWHSGTRFHRKDLCGNNSPIDDVDDVVGWEPAERYIFID